MAGIVKQSQRKVVVLTSLVAVLTLTSALLLVLAPQPLSGESYNSLWATEDNQDYLQEVFHTTVPTRADADGWKFIYIHHSATASGNAMTLGQTPDGLGDHFVIGNGDGCADGEIQMSRRWMQQLAPGSPRGVNINPRCISICLIGDFDNLPPTPAQVHRLAQLVSTLQNRLRIDGKSVWFLDQTGSPAGIGRYFPQTAFRGTILP